MVENKTFTKGIGRPKVLGANNRALFSARFQIGLRLWAVGIAVHTDTSART